METKVCKKCNVPKLVNNFRERKITGKDTLYRIGTCNECEKELAKEYGRAKHGYHPRGTPRQDYKVVDGKPFIRCSCCDKLKPLEEFHKSTKNKIFGVMGKCKQCRSEKRKIDSFNTTDYKDMVHKVFLACKNRANTNNILFTITEEDIIIPTVCPYLNIPIEYRGSRDTSPSVDRIDNSKGYEKGNIRVISFLANAMKRDANISTLLNFAHNIISLHS